MSDMCALFVCHQAFRLAVAGWSLLSENEKEAWKPAAAVDPNSEILASDMPGSIESIET